MKAELGGLRTRYEVSGTGPAVALIHGVGGALDMWDGVVARLAGRHTVLRYDLRGHGESAKPAGPYSLETFVADLRFLLDHLGWQRCHVAGFSLGGLIAQGFALAHPGRLDRLAILSAVAGRTPDERARVVARADAMDRAGANATVGAAIERWFTPAFREAHPEVVEARRRQVLANDPLGYAAAYRVFAESDLADRLHEIAAPAYIATGEFDEGSTPRMSRLMGERMAGARVEILPDLKHSILLEAPDLVADRLARFFG